MNHATSSLTRAGSCSKRMYMMIRGLSRLTKLSLYLASLGFAVASYAAQNSRFSLNCVGQTRDGLTAKPNAAQVTLVFSVQLGDTVNRMYDWRTMDWTLFTEVDNEKMRYGNDSRLVAYFETIFYRRTGKFIDVQGHGGGVRKGRLQGATT
jgi:hypothetical protein